MSASSRSQNLGRDDRIRRPKRDEDARSYRFLPANGNRLNRRIGRDDAVHATSTGMLRRARRRRMSFAVRLCYLKIKSYLCLCPNVARFRRCTTVLYRNY